VFGLPVKDKMRRDMYVYGRSLKKVRTRGKVHRIAGGAHERPAKASFISLILERIVYAGFPHTMHLKSASPPFSLLPDAQPRI